MSVAERMKLAVGGAMAGANPQCRFDRAVFVIGHMRCGSTALSNILVDRPDISGYGEAHVAYGSRAALGVLVMNQQRRGSWRAGATHLFDKILHSRYDARACAEFFTARAIFIARTPAETLPSIRTLFAKLGSAEYATDAECAAYYTERMQQMAALWDRFPPANRLAMTHAELVGDPDAALARITAQFGFDPPLANAYRPRSAAARGAGDPLSAHRFTGIQARQTAPAGPINPDFAGTTVSTDLMGQLNHLYERFADLAESSGL